MAFDGITIAAMVQELHKNLDNGRFNKIAQPEAKAKAVIWQNFTDTKQVLLTRKMRMSRGNHPSTCRKKRRESG